MKKYLLSITIISLVSVSLLSQTTPAQTSLAVGTNSTAANGQNAFAFGLNSQATGTQFSTAASIGYNCKATGTNSIVIGLNSSSSAEQSIAIGNAALSNAFGSLALGNFTTASGVYSTAIGSYIGTGGKKGAFAIGDVPSNNTQTNNDADNQMMMRFAGGYKYFVNNNNQAFAINPNGTVGIDQSNLNNGTVNSGLIFGNGSGEGIASKRTGGGNQYGLDFYSNFINRMSITNGGNIGIGTPTPSAKFSLATNGEELAGTVPSKIFKTYSGVLGTSAGSEIKLANFGFKSGNWTSLGIGAYRYNGADGWQNASIVFAYDVDNTSGAGSYFALCGNGNFGIGTVAPGAKLHVAGNILASGTITPSDIRYKKDIRPMKDALKKIMALSGYYYSLRKDEFPDMQFDSGPQLGLIAQDVEKVLPQIVYTTQNGYKGVDYTKIVPLLIEGMKEQQKQIDELKKMVDALIRR